MKKFLLFFAIVAIVISCSIDEQHFNEQEAIEVSSPASEQEKQGNPVAVDETGKLIYMEEVSNKMKLENAAEDFVYLKPEQNLSKNNVKGKGKKVRTIELAPSVEPTVSTMAITNIMLDPVTIPDTYAEPLPEPIGQSAMVDWDGDGVEDLFEIHNRCYFPRSFSWVTVNGVMINNSIAFNAQILGFDDVDGDGNLDVLLEGGNHNLYNAIDGVNNGADVGEITEPYSPFNVGYNTVGETPDPLAEMLDSLVVVQDVNNPDFVRWNLGNFINGVSQYEGYVFHVYWIEVDPVTLEPLPGAVGYQTHTYGEWGIGNSHLPVSGTVAMRITNADDTTPPNMCEDKWIYVSY